MGMGMQKEWKYGACVDKILFGRLEVKKGLEQPRRAKEYSIRMDLK
jgi:hypothetical protein